MAVPAPAQQPASTKSAVVRAVSYSSAAFRVATLLQMLPALGTALVVTEHYNLAVVTWVVAVVALISGAVLILLQKRPLNGTWSTVDVAIAVALLVAGWWTVPLEMRTGTWEGFQMGYALCIACQLVAVRSRVLWVCLFGALLLAEASYELPTVHELEDVPSTVGHLLTTAFFAPLLRYLYRVIVQVGEQADEARMSAATLAKAEEERRARLAIHNGTAVLGLLVNQKDEAPNGLDHLRSQAEIEVNRMRAYLSGGTSVMSHEQDLSTLVSQVSSDFTDLPITATTDLARGVVLSGPELSDLDAALRSLLLNVRAHAKASRVVLHAEQTEERAWTVSIHDNGIGFDTEGTPLGVGLQDVVVDQLATHGITTDIVSLPGVGTMITLQAGAPAHDR